MNLRWLMVGTATTLVVAGLTSCAASTAGHGRADTSSAGGSPTTTTALPAAGHATASDPPAATGELPRRPQPTGGTVTVTVTASTTTSAAAAASPTPPTTPAPVATTPAPVAPTPAPVAPTQLVGPTSVQVALVDGPDCSTNTGDVDVVLSWTSSNADAVWSLTQGDITLLPNIEDPRTDGGRHIARVGITDFLFDCNANGETYVFRSYNAADFGTDVLYVGNNI